jgi:hypothetical protein
LGKFCPKRQITPNRQKTEKAQVICAFSVLERHLREHQAVVQISNCWIVFASKKKMVQATRVCKCRQSANIVRQEQIRLAD